MMEKVNRIFLCGIFQFQEEKISGKMMKEVNSAAAMDVSGIIEYQRVQLKQKEGKNRVRKVTKIHFGYFFLNFFHFSDRKSTAVEKSSGFYSGSGGFRHRGTSAHHQQQKKEGTGEKSENRNQLEDFFEDSFCLRRSESAEEKDLVAAWTNKHQKIVA